MNERRRATSRRPSAVAVVSGKSARNRRRAMTAQGNAGSQQREIVEPSPSGWWRSVGQNLKSVLSVATAVIAACAVAVSVWAGVNASRTARETQQMADAVQLTTQFTTATEQLGSSSASAQLGAVLAVDQLMVTDPATYQERGCRTLRGFVTSATPREGQEAADAGPSITEALVVLTKHCIPEYVDSSAVYRFANLNLSGEDLTYADLTYANLTRANLTRAKLTDAILTYANLNDAQLRHAHLTRADLAATNLTGADLTRASFSDDTRWPGGFDPAMHDMIRR